jgi:hypothetical protein
MKWMRFGISFFYFKIINTSFQIEFTLEDEDDRVLVDATEVPIAKPTVAWVQNATWSGYKKRNTLKYEVAISEMSGLPISYSGPFCGATGDVTIFKNYLRERMIERGYRGLADGTYQGQSDVLTVPPHGYLGDTTDEAETRKALSHRRIKVENFFGRMKKFRILRDPFRHNLTDHHDVFNVILQLTTMELLSKPLRKQE